MKTILSQVLICTLLFNLSACNNFFKFSKGASSEKISEAIWSATIIEKGTTHGKFEKLTLQFSPSGRVVAKCKTCEVNGYWYEDALFNKFILCFEPSEDLCHLNKCWDVQLSGSAAVVLKSADASDPLTLTLRIT